MERSGTFGDDDPVGLVMISPGGTKRESVLGQTQSRKRPRERELGEAIEAEMQIGAAYACLSSNKQGRMPGNVPCVNEDKTQLAYMHLDHNNCEETVLFAAVFDGHGGTGKAAEFVSERLKDAFLQHYNKIETAVFVERIALALQQSFTATDHEFYKHVLAEAARADIKLRAQDSFKCCRFFKEDPCVCRKPPIPANEGSTATVAVITSTHVICANVGDSDAFVVQMAVADSSDDGGSADASPLSNSSTSTFAGSSLDTKPENDCTTTGSNKRQRMVLPCDELELVQLSVSHTPLVDESNEDYKRIRAIAEKQAKIVSPDVLASGPKPPTDGILRSVRGSRYNYVSVPGARSLNMVRAFGNLGNKLFVEGKLVEQESPIIPRPDVRIMARESSMRAIILGSDGLWDNLDQRSVADVIKEWLFISGREPEEASKQCATQLMFKALKANRKPDDISIVLVPLLDE